MCAFVSLSRNRVVGYINRYVFSCDRFSVVMAMAMAMAMVDSGGGGDDG